ncbi:MAG TPA: putative selenate ABC transporter substrate-binding protein [Verrucomicrobiales bacterium]|nr:putative selenate ABC transporter substrate-binding protein [Verrucomicrobiales bacterium]
MKRFLAQFAGVAAVVAALSHCAPSSKKETVLRFSAIPDQNQTELAEKFDRIAERLSQDLGVPVEYVPATDYKASVELFRNGDVHLAWFGGLTGVQAHHSVPGARAIAQGEEDPEFYSYFIAHRDAGLTPSDTFPEALGSLSFTFGPESSTSGRLLPEFFLRENTGKSPSGFFSKPPGFSTSHDHTVELVESGQVQAGVVNYAVYRQRVAEGKTDPEVCQVIWTTPTYADYNFTAHPDLKSLFGAGFTEKLQAALLSLDGGLLSAFPRAKLIPASNEDYAGIAEVARELGFLQ